MESVPDLLDRRGRLRRLAVAAIVATAAAVPAASITYVKTGVGFSLALAHRTAWPFVGAVAWLLSFLGTRWLLERRDRRRNPPIPAAAVRRDGSTR